jgi:hypothetical protein
MGDMLLCVEIQNSDEKKIQIPQVFYTYLNAKNWCEYIFCLDSLKYFLNSVYATAST